MLRVNKGLLSNYFSYMMNKRYIYWWVVKLEYLLTFSVFHVEAIDKGVETRWR